MLRNMKIRIRMLLSYAVIILLCLCASVVALVMLNGVGDNLTSFYDNNYAVTVNVATARREMQSARADILRAILESDPVTVEEKLETASASLTNMRETFPTIRQVFKGDSSMLDELDDSLADAVGYRDQVFELVRANRSDEAFEIMKYSYVPRLNKIADKLQEIANAAGVNAQKMVQEGKQTQKTAVALVVMIIGLGTAFAVVIGLYISDTVRKPVSEVGKAAQKLADGELEAAQVRYASEDELGDLSNHIRNMISSQQRIISDIAHVLGDLAKGDFTTNSKIAVSYIGDYREILMSMMGLRDNLSSTLQQINQVADQVAAGGDQVSSSAQALAQGSTDQAGSVEALAGTINEISEQVEGTAKNAEAARAQTKQAGCLVAACNTQMQEMIEAMSEISYRSSEIRKIIKTIEDIAFQTNILALNAAVEAARAGNVGKGFAVVAGEVRSLASKSAVASKDTSALIEGSMQAVEKGMKIADETAQSLLYVVESAQAAAVTVDSIAGAAKLQAASLAQVTQEIDQISNVIHTNSATSEESAAASEELSGQAQMLKELVAQFRLQNHEASLTWKNESAGTPPVETRY